MIEVTWHARMEKLMKISCLEIFFGEHSFLTGPMYQIKIIVCVCVCVCVLSHVQLFATPWTVACRLLFS